MLNDPRNRAVLLVLLTIGLAGTVILTVLCGVLRGERYARLRRRLLHRVRLWWIMGAVLVVAASAGRNGSIVVFAIASFFLLRELVTITPTRRADYLSLVLAFFVVLPLHYVVLASDWYGMFLVLIPTYAFLLLPVCSALSGDPGRFLERTAKIQWALMVGVYFASHVPALLQLRIGGFEDRSLGLLVYLVVVVQANDVARSVIDELVPCPDAEPDGLENIRWPGVLAGAVSATVFGLALRWIATPFSIAESIGMSAAVGLLATGGARCAVIIHRDQGSSSLAVSYREAGIMDQLASLCFAAPVFFHLTGYYWGPPGPGGIF